MQDPDFEPLPPETQASREDPDFEPLPSLQEVEADENTRLGALFKASLQTEPDRHAGILELARQTRAPADVVEQRFDDLKRTWEGAQFDPIKWREANPELAKLVLEQPQVGPVVMKDEKISWLGRQLRQLKAAYDFWSLSTVSEEKKQSGFGSGDEAVQAIETEKAKFDQAFAPKQVPTVVAPEAEADGITRPFILARAEYRRTTEGLERSKLGFEMMTRRAAGQDTWDLEKKATDLEQALVQREYGQGAVEQLLLDAVSALPSQVETLKGAGAGGVLGATAGAVAGGVASRSAAGAQAGAKTGLSLGAKAGMAAMSFELEAGSAFLEYRSMKTDDGRAMDENTAIGAALIYGTAAAAIEVGSFGVMLEAYGPLGEAIKSGTGKAFLRNALQNQTFRQLASKAGKAWLKAGAAEGGEEFAQQVTQDAVGWLARSATAGGAQSARPFESVLSGVEAAQQGFLGGLVIGAPGPLVSLTTQSLQHAKALKAGKQIEAIAQISDSPTVKAAPEAVARMIANATAEGGEKVTHVYVDPVAFTRLFQDENSDPREAAAQLLGPEGPRTLMEARVLGQKLEIPLETYLEKWGPTQAAMKLAQDTTTQPGHLTPRQLQEREKEIEAKAKELAEKYSKEDSRPTGDEGVWADTLERQLVATKQVTAEQAKKQVDLHRAFIRTQAEAFGVDPAELFRDFVVQAQRGGEKAPEVAPRLSPEDMLLDRARKLTPEERASETYLDTNTGLLNERAFRELPAAPDKPLVGHISVEGVKFLNDNVSHDRADLLYRAVAQALMTVAPEAAKVGGDFAVRVKDEAELQAIVDQVQKALPVRGFAVTGAVGEDFKAAGAAHGEIKAAAEAAGARAARGQRPMGLQGAPESIAFPEAKRDAPVPQALAERLQSLTPEQYFNERYRDQVSGVWTAEGWAALPRRANVVAFDLRGLKEVNQRFGEAMGDQLIEGFKLLSKRAGGEFFDFAHLHGDEYAAQGDNLDDVARFIRRLRAEAEANPLKYLDSEVGEVRTAGVVRFRHGIGKWTYEAADRDLNRRKSAELSGEGGGVGGFGEADAEADLGVQRGERPGSESDTGASEGSDSGPGGLRDEARMWIARMRSPERKAQARAWYEFTTGLRTDRPQVSPGLEKEFAARFGLVDPEGFAFGEDGRSLERRLAGKRTAGGNLYGAEASNAEDFRKKVLGKLWQDAELKILEQPAWHGTPHEFDRFSLHAIGTGEGAQAYGWGLYFAGAKQVAEYYRAALSGRPQLLINGVNAKDLSQNRALKLPVMRLQNAVSYDSPEMIEKAIGEIQAISRQEAAEMKANVDEYRQKPEQNPRTLAILESELTDLEKVREWADGLSPKSIKLKAGQTYQVEVPEDSELLDYDRPLSEQPQPIREAIDRILVKAVGYAASEIENVRERNNEPVPEGTLAEATGKEIYLYLMGKTGSPKAASEALLAVGIPGLRYLDGVSRNTGEGSHNYVIWDEGRVEITNRLYQSAKGGKKATKQTATPEFKAWFKGSKVVDQKGKPLVVFHGTNYHGFEEFKPELADPNGLYGPGFYFTQDRSVAESYTDKSARLAEGKGNKPGVYQVYLSLQNPIDAAKPAREYVAQLKQYKAKAPPPPTIKRMIDSALREEAENFTIEGLGAWVDNTEWAFNIAEKEGKNGEELLAPYFDYVVEKARDYMVREIQAKRWGTGDDIIGFIKRQVFERLDASKGDSNIKDVLQRFGFDGIAHVGGNIMGNGHEHQVFIAFEPTQVKAAEGNRGTFDSTDPNIYHQGPRGYTELAREGMRRVMNVALNPTADLSTFLHETGHVFLEVFADLAAREDAPARVREDFAATLKWLGIESRDGIQREHHEQWARAFEAYLLEGKAPTPKLAGAFETFKLWLKQIYRSIKSLNVELSDEIRGVFDRLLATDEEIARAKQAMGLKQLFRSPEEAGMTPEQWQAYLDAAERATSTATRQTELRVLKDRLRVTENWWKEQEAQEREAAGKEYEELRARQMERLIKGLGFNERGEVVKLGEPTKLDTAVVKLIAGEKDARKIPTQKGGAHPDEIGELFGFPTGQHAIDALLSLPAKDVWTKARAAVVMEEKYPEVLADKQQMRELAAKGLHGEHTASWLLREWEALRSKTAGGWLSAPVEAIQKAAKQIADRKTVARLDAGGVLRSERAAAEQAAKAVAKGNFEQAAVFKQQQLLNMYLHRELTQAAEDRDAFLELAGDLAKDKARAKLGKANPIYRDGVDLLLESFGLKDPEEREKPLASLGEVVNQMTNDGSTVMFDEEVLSRLLGQPKDWRGFTVAELREVLAALKNIRAAARAVSTVLVEGKRLDKAQVVDQLVMEAQQNLHSLGPFASSESARTAFQRLSAGVSAIDGSLLKPEVMIRGMLGGGDLGSIWFRALMKPLQEAKAKEVDLLKQTIKPILEAFEKVPKDVRARWQEKVDGASLFPTHRSDVQAPTRRFELLMMALNAGNESNLERLLGGRNITEQQVRAAIDLLTQEELDWVQSVWDAAESLWPEASALEERDSGLAPPKIARKPLTTRHGVYAGGYFPAVYDRRVEPVGEKQVASTLAGLMDPSYTRPSTARSHLKNRVEGFTGAISLEPGNIPAHLAQVAHDLAFREPLKSVGGLILSPKIQAVLKDRLGDGRARQFLTWIKDVGQMRGIEGFQHAGAFMKAMRAIRANTVIAALGYAVPNAIEDLSNLVAAIPRTELKAKHLAAALSEFMGAPLQSVTRALEKSGELRTRHEQVQRELQKQIRDITARGGLPNRALRWVKDHAFVFMEFSDKATSTPVWMGAYRQAIDEGKSEAEAVTFADVVVRQVFPSHSPVDTAPILRDKGVIGSTLMFYGFLSTYYNGLRELGFGGRALAYMMAVSVLSEFLRGRGREGDEEWEEWFLRKMLAGSLSALPWGGDLANTIEGKFLGKRTNPRVVSLVSVGAQIGEAVMSLPDDGKEAGKRLKDLLRGLGPVIGLPTAQPIRTGSYLLDLADGNTEARNPFDFASGAIYGEKEGQPENPVRMIGDAISGSR